MKKAIREVIVVEGRYDKNALSQVVDATIITLGGFAVFNDREKLAFLRRLAGAEGAHRADGQRWGRVRHPELSEGCSPTGSGEAGIYPGHPRQGAPQADPRQRGQAGRGGYEAAVLLEALRRAGATFADEGAAECPGDPITKADLFALGLTGGTDSAAKRRALLKQLDLPEHLTPNGMLEALNLLYSREEFLSRMVKTQ